MDIILDTETTTLKDHDQIIEISIINVDTGAVLLDQRIKPTVNIHPDALKYAPAWPEINDRVYRLMGS